MDRNIATIATAKDSPKPFGGASANLLQHAVLTRYFNIAFHALLNTDKPKFKIFSNRNKQPELRRYLFVIVLFVSETLLFYFAFSTFYQQSIDNVCESPISYGTKTNVQIVSSGNVQNFMLPPARYPNGIVFDKDGSVWFGEEGLPGIAHLFMNGTLFEFKFPGQYTKSKLTGRCTIKTEIWSLALWNGGIYAPDTSKNRIIGLDLQNFAFKEYPIPTGNAYPYYLASGPDGNLWFTEVYSSKIAYLSPQGLMKEYNLPTGIRGTPTQISFINLTTALYSDAGQAGTNNGGLFLFSVPNDYFTKLTQLNSTGMTSFVYFGNEIWFSIHGPNYVEMYNMTNHELLAFPTSPVGYSTFTLPYFIKSNGSAIWFNEHFGNRMAVINPVEMSMVEYSVSSPPSRNLSSIKGILTFSVSHDRACFTEFNSNAIGCLESNKIPTLRLMLTEKEISISPGERREVNLSYTSLSGFQFQWFVGFPNKIRGNPFNVSLTVTKVNESCVVSIYANRDAMHGKYILALSLTNGEVSFTKFVIVDLS